MIRPMPNYILVEPIEDDRTSAGGVYLPESSKDKPMKGKVVAVSEYMFLPNGDSVKIGILSQDVVTLSSIYGKIKMNSIIYYKRWINETVISEGKEYIFVKYEDILGIES
jgi:chaperonin GroES